MDENEKDLARLYPSLYKYLLSHKEKLSKRNKDETGIRYEWYCLQRYGANYYEDFEKEKIVYPETSQGAYFMYDSANMFLEKTSFMIISKKINTKFLLGLLSSNLITFYFKNFCGGCILGNNAYQYNKQALEKLPIPKITKENQNLADSVVELIEQILTLKERNSTTYTSRLEREIDSLVFKLYGLNEEQISLLTQ